MNLTLTMVTGENITVLINEPAIESGDTCELVIGNALTIDNTSSRIKAIYQSLEKYAAFRVKSEEIISTIDMGGLQTLLFINNYCSEQNKQVQFNLRLAENIIELFQNTGFDFLVESK
ncbi:MAG: hypothetical protein GVY19_00180 [Bacteroidetes bacterium]|nr:hypothetical protein [Bacteroidota bacterium]